MANDGPRQVLVGHVIEGRQRTQHIWVDVLGPTLFEPGQNLDRENSQPFGVCRVQGGLAESKAAGEP